MTAAGGGGAAAAAAELPTPSSGLFLEVSFRRLLASCEDIVGGTSQARPDLVGCWQRSPVFHHYVETLQEQLADLEAAAGSRLPRSTLEQYTEHVEALASQLLPPDLPAFCCGPAAQPGAALPMQQQQQADAAAGAALAALPAAPRPPAVPPPAPLARTPQLPAATHKPASLPAGVQQQEPAAAPAAGRAAQLPAVPSVRLQVQQQLHEDLAEELAGLAAQLKTNTLAIEGRLKERGQLLDSTDAALDKSVQRTRESKERAAQIHRRGRANLCLTCLVMLLVGLAFAGMYVFIKLARLGGYRAAPTLLPAPPPPVPVPLTSDGVPVYEEHYAEL